MHAALARAPALARLGTRADDDFSIALLDAAAVMGDILTFYQERIANENYLRTATERRSVLEMARLIGYELSPGVAASTYLAFTVEKPPALPTGAAMSQTVLPSEVTIEVGTKVQSIPGPGELPQTFETVEKGTVKAEWNRLQPRLTSPQKLVLNDTSAYLRGTTTNLKPGDTILVVGAEVERDAKSPEGLTCEFWDFRRLTVVEPDADNDRTQVRWDEPLGELPRGLPASEDQKVYTFRLQASLFGHNAPEWRSLPVGQRSWERVRLDGGTWQYVPGLYHGREGDWADARLKTNVINLDAVYSKIAVGSWVVLAKPADKESKWVELYAVTDVSEETKSDFGITAKTTRVKANGENIDKFSPRETSVYAQSELLEMAEAPLTATELGLEAVVENCEAGMLKPVGGSIIELDRQVWGLVKAKRLAVSGKPVRLRWPGLKRSETCPPDVFGDDTSYILLEKPTVSESGLQMHLGNRAGNDRTEICSAKGHAVLIPAWPDDKVVSESVSVESAPDGTAELTLEKSLMRYYDRATVSISANVIRATHGETVNREVLGSGDGSQVRQQFTLKQPPLTWLNSSQPGGVESTLEVRVNDIKWHDGVVPVRARTR